MISDEFRWAEDLRAPAVEAVRARATDAADRLRDAAAADLPHLEEWVTGALAAGHRTHTVPVASGAIRVEYDSTDVEVASATVVALSGGEPRRVRLAGLLGPGAAGTVVGWTARADGARLGFVVRPPGSRFDTLHVSTWDGPLRDADQLYRSPARFCACGRHVVCFRAGGGGWPRLWLLDVDAPTEDRVLWDGLGRDFTYGLTSIGADGVGYVSARRADEPVNSVWSLAMRPGCAGAGLRELPAVPSLAAVQRGADGRPVVRFPRAADRDLAVLDEDGAGWTAVPAGQMTGRVTGFAPAGDHLVVVRSTATGAHVVVRTPAGQSSREYPGHQVDVFAADPAVDAVSVLVGGWTRPATSAVVPAGGVLSYLDSVCLSPAGLTVTAAEQASDDGRRVRSIDLAGQRTRDGAPTIIWVYGGFGVLPQPTFSPAILAWLACGGRFVIALVRGGGGGGEAWQEAGTGRGKLAACADIVAIADRMVAAGLADPARIVVQGGSHGGLLAALTALRHPDRIAGFVANKAPLDLIALNRLAQGSKWRREFGDSVAVHEELSPVELLGTGDRCPPGLLVYAVDDAVVSAANSTKFLAVAQARHATTPAAVEHDHGGHVDRRDRDSRRDEITRIVSFAWLARASDVTRGRRSAGHGASAPRSR